MAQHAHADSETDPSVEAQYRAGAHHGNYVRIWMYLVALLAISVAGPFLGHPLITLATAFGIAVVKAYMVAKNFMHITVAPRYVAYLIGTCLVFMLLFYAGVAPDVMKRSGTNWQKPAWVAAHAKSEAEGEHGALADWPEDELP